MTDIQVIDGRYEVLGTIGVGGMGVLYRARDPWIGGRTVAIKVLKDGLDDDEIRTRFKQEASAAGVLEHENIVRIFDVGEHEGQPFIAMEYVDGDTLASLVKARAPIPLLQKLEFAEQLCDALGYAHAHGIVHRDIKPLNLIIERRRQRLKVLDFGIAKMANSGLTSAGMMIGTVNYMSPEQMRGDVAIDHRSDVFAVGATLFELFTGQRAFPGGIADGLMGRIMTQPAPSMLALVTDLPVELEQIVQRALAKRPDERYPTLVQMRDEIRALRYQLRQGPDRTATQPAAVPEARAAGDTARGAAPSTALPVVPPPPSVSSTRSPAPVPPGEAVTVSGITPPPALPAVPVLATATTVGTSRRTLVQAPPPDRSSRRFGVFVAVLAGAVGLTAVALWLFVPWDVVLRPWRAGPGPATAATEPAQPAVSTHDGETAPGNTSGLATPAADATSAAQAAVTARLAPVTVAIDAQPWAEARLVGTLPEREAASLPPDVVRDLARERGPFTTPFTVDLPPGTYLVTFENRPLGLSHTERITIDRGGEDRFRFDLPGFDVDRAIGELLRGGQR